MCSQLFTRQHDEFIFGNDTVTARELVCRRLSKLTVKRVTGSSPPTVKQLLTSAFGRATGVCEIRLHNG